MSKFSAGRSQWRRIDDGIVIASLSKNFRFLWSAPLIICIVCRKCLTDLGAKLYLDARCLAYFDQTMGCDLVPVLHALLPVFTASIFFLRIIDRCGSRERLSCCLGMSRLHHRSFSYSPWSIPKKNMGKRIVFSAECPTWNARYLSGRFNIDCRLMISVETFLYSRIQLLKSLPSVLILLFHLVALIHPHGSSHCQISLQDKRRIFIYCKPFRYHINP